MQPFNNNKAIAKPKLIKLNDYNFIHNKKVSYVSDNILLLRKFNKNFFEKIQKDLFQVRFDLNQLPHIIKKNMLINKNPKPLYVSNYY